MVRATPEPAITDPIIVMSAEAEVTEELIMCHPNPSFPVEGLGFKEICCFPATFIACLIFAKFVAVVFVGSL